MLLPLQKLQGDASCGSAVGIVKSLKSALRWYVLQIYNVDLFEYVGKLGEYDEPSKLLDTNSYFSKLVAEYWSSCNRN